MADSILTRARPLMLARLLAAVLTIAVPMVLARALVPEEYGTFKQAALLWATLQFILPMGLTQSLYYFVPREPERQRIWIGHTLLGMTALGLLAGGLLLLGRPLVAAHFENPQLDLHLRWIALCTALTLAGMPLDVALTAQGRIGGGAVARVVTDVFRGGAMALGAWLTQSVTGLFMGLALATFVRAAATWVVLLRRPGIGVDLGALRKQLRYALPFGVAFVLVIPQQQFHQYAVAATVTAAAYAVYAVGCFQLPVVDVLYTPVSEILQLGLAEEDRRGIRRGPALFHEAVSRLSFAFLPMMALLFVVAPTLIGFLYTDRYLAATPIFRVALLGMALAALPLDGVMRARAQNRFMLGASAVKLAVTVPLVWLALRAYGPLGAMAGWIAAETVGRGILLARAGRLFGTGLRGVLPWRELGRQSVAAVVAAPAAALALHLVPGARFVSLAAAGTAYGLVYLGICLLAGWVPPEWRTMVRIPARARRVAAAADPATEPRVS